MAYRPRIGLTMRLELATRRFYLGRDYSEAVEACGGLPVHIPLIADKDYIAGVVGQLDGILLPGSDTDVDPLRYGEEPHRGLKTVINEKDVTDMLVLDEAERLNLPVLAICYGMQALNVARGGTLIQDIQAQISDSIKHEQGSPLGQESHSVELLNDCLFSKIIAGKLRWKVNSHHHQAVAKLGRNLEAVAWATDGIVEGIQDPRPGVYVVGTQWHPELSWQTDDMSRGIFESFISACGRKAGSEKIGDGVSDELALVGVE